MENEKSVQEKIQDILTAKQSYNENYYKEHSAKIDKFFETVGKGETPKEQVVLATMENLSSLNSMQQVIDKARESLIQTLLGLDILKADIEKTVLEVAATNNL